MDFQKFMQPRELEKNSFLWSEIRLVVAAVALFIGGTPPVLKITPYALYGFVSSLLTIAWIVSGLASLYLLYRWNGAGKMLFGRKNTKDTAAFFVSVVSGVNLGVAGLLSKNIGMSISSNYGVFIIVGLVYLAAAFQLYSRWKANGEKLF